MSRNLLVVGSSGSGKTHLISQLRRLPAHHNQQLQIPRRVTSRQIRPSDPHERIENDFVTPTEFQRLKKSNSLLFHWTKEVPNDTEHSYGFAKTGATGLLTVYSANNYLLTYPRALPRRLKERLVVVQIVADGQTRATRLLSRAKPLSPKELAFRLLDVPQERVKLPIHVKINNGAQREQEAEECFLALIRGLLEHPDEQR